MALRLSIRWALGIVCVPSYNRLLCVMHENLFPIISGVISTNLFLQSKKWAQVTFIYTQDFICLYFRMKKTETYILYRFIIASLKGTFFFLVNSKRGLRDNVFPSYIWLQLLPVPFFLPLHAPQLFFVWQLSCSSYFYHRPGKTSHTWLRFCRWLKFNMCVSVIP